MTSDAIYCQCPVRPRITGACDTLLSRMHVRKNTEESGEPDPRRILMLRVLYFLGGLSGSTWGRFSTIYFNTSLHLTPTQIGIIEATMPGVRLFFQPMWGFVADVFHAKKMVYLVTSIISSSLLVLQAFPQVTTGFFPALIINGILSAFVAGGVLDAYCLEYLAKFDRTRMYGTIRLWTAVSWGVGSIGMGLLTDYTKGDFTYNFMLFGAMSLTRIVCIWYFIPDRKPDSKKKKKKKLSKGKDMIGHLDFNSYSVQGKRNQSICIDEPNSSLGTVPSYPSSFPSTNSLSGESHDVDIVSPPQLPREITTQDQLTQSLLILEERRNVEDFFESKESLNRRDKHQSAGSYTTSEHSDDDDVDLDEEQEPLWEVVKTVFELKFLWFLTEVMILGAGIGVVERLLFVYLQNDLKASTTLCGLTVGVTVLFELPLFSYTDTLMKILGHDGMFVLAMLAFCVRCYGYTLLTEETKWWILPLEALHGVTFALMWSAAVEFAKLKSPKGWDSTMQAILVTAWRCLGLGIGAAVGGWVMDNYGARFMYRGASFVVGAFLVFHLLFSIIGWCSSLCRPKGAQKAPH